WEHPVYGDSAAGHPEGTPYLQGAVLMLDAVTGDVLAMVGGRDFSHSRFNRAVGAWRQPASAFKPFIYAAAIAAGYSPAHRLDDSPRSEEHTSELQSRENLVCRLLLEKKKRKKQ